MKKHSLASDIILFVVVFCVLSTALAQVCFARPIVENETALTNARNVEVVDTSNTTYLISLQNDCLLKMDYAHQMAEQARFLGYSEDSVIVEIARHDWWMYYDLYHIYKNRYEDIISMAIVTDEQIAEYPVASKVWRLLKENGYSDYVCAGIIGNMMAECGGQTLTLDPYAYSPSGYYYGLCQWNRSAYYFVFDTDVERQIEVLLNTIEEEMDNFGFCYYSGFDYDEFLKLEDEQDVALAFAMCYERCGGGTYYVRQLNATEAYEYFTN